MSPPSNVHTTQAWLRQAMATQALHPHPNQHPNVARVSTPSEGLSNVELAISDLANIKLLHNIAHIPGQGDRDPIQQDRRDVWTQTAQLLRKRGYRVVGAGMQWGDIQVAREIFGRDAFDVWISVPTALKNAKDTGQTEAGRFEEPHAFLLYNSHNTQASVLQEFLQFLAPDMTRPRHTFLLMPPLEANPRCMDEAMMPFMDEAKGRLAVIKSELRRDALEVALQAEPASAPPKPRM